MKENLEMTSSSSSSTTATVGKNDENLFVVHVVRQFPVLHSLVSHLIDALPTIGALHAVCRDADHALRQEALFDAVYKHRFVTCFEKKNPDRLAFRTLLKTNMTLLSGRFEIHRFDDVTRCATVLESCYTVPTYWLEFRIVFVASCFL